METVFDKAACIVRLMAGDAFTRQQAETLADWYERFALMKAEARAAKFREETYYAARDR